MNPLKIINTVPNNIISSYSFDKILHFTEATSIFYGMANQAGGMNPQALFQMGQSQPQANQAVSAGAAPAAATSWTCSCGHSGNTGKFCAECGSPAPTTSWTCSCGHTGNTGKFCAECGKPRA